MKKMIQSCCKMMDLNEIASAMKEKHQEKQRSPVYAIYWMSRLENGSASIIRKVPQIRYTSMRKGSWNELLGRIGTGRTSEILSPGLSNIQNQWRRCPDSPRRILKTR